MAAVIKDRVYETTSSTGTTNLLLSGPVDLSFLAFSTVCANGDTFRYAAVDDTNHAFEIGTGTYISASNSIARSATESSSNAGALVSFAASPRVFITTTASQFSGMVPVSFNVDFNQGVIVANGTITLLRKSPSVLTITSLDYEVGSAGGSFTVDIQIGGATVIGLAGISVSSATSSNAVALSANAVSVGQAITAVISGVTGLPTGANLQINGTR